MGSRQESGYRVNTAVSIFSSPGTGACLPRAAHRCVGLPRASHQRQGQGRRCSPPQDAPSFTICKMVWLEQTDSRGPFQP